MQEEKKTVRMFLYESRVSGASKRGQRRDSMGRRINPMLAITIAIGIMVATTFAMKCQVPTKHLVYIIIIIIFNLLLIAT